VATAVLTIVVLAAAVLDGGISIPFTVVGPASLGFGVVLAWALCSVVVHLVASLFGLLARISVGRPGFRS
jgi:hypothetical protein